MKIVSGVVSLHLLYVNAEVIERVLNTSFCSVLNTVNNAINCITQ